MKDVSSASCHGMTCCVMMSSEWLAFGGREMILSW